MWGRKGAAISVKRDDLSSARGEGLCAHAGLDQKEGRDMAAGKEESAIPDRPRCRSWAQVSPDSSPTRQRTAPLERASTGVVPSRGRRVVAPGADNNTRSGGGSGRITWRWPSRRLEHSPASLGSSDECLSSPGGAVGSSSRRRRLVGGNGGKSAVSSATASTTTTTAAAAAAVVASLTRGRNRRQHPRRDVDSAIVAESSAPLPLTLLDNNNESNNPERLVASLLLNHNRATTMSTNNSEPPGSPLQQEHPISPATSAASDSTPGWAERAGLTCGVPAGASAATATTTAAGGDIFDSSSCVVKKDRDVPRFLRPVILFLSLSLLALFGTRVGRGIRMFGPSAYAAGGAALPEAVVDDIFDRADTDHDGVIADTEIQHLVQGAGGTLLDDASEIEAGVRSVFRNLDQNADHSLSRSDLLSYWGRLGTLLTVDEVAQWVMHAVQLPQDVADIFRNNMVTGYDFPELAADQGVQLEQDLGVTRPAYRKRLVRSMKWKLWAMGEEPAAPEKLRASDASCGTVKLEWNPSENNASFPVHKFVLRRASLGEGEGTEEWVTVMDGPDRSFFDARLQPGAVYRYSLQAWNALGHSSTVDVDVLVATEQCLLGASWGWWLGGTGYGTGSSAFASDAILGFIAALVSSAVGMICLAVRGGKKKGRSDEEPSGGRRNNGDLRAPRGGRPEPLLHPASFDEADGDGGGLSGGDGHVHGLPVKNSSNGSGGGWSDQRQKYDQRRRLSSASTSSSSRPAPVPKGSLRRSSSDAAAVTGAIIGGRGSAQSGGVNGGAGRESSRRLTEITAAESIRKEASRRYMTRKSTSREEKDVCTLCHKEWRWYRLRGRHTCCSCHKLFCHSCGDVTHSFGACPVGGTCMCNNCLGSMDR